MHWIALIEYFLWCFRNLLILIIIPKLIDKSFQSPKYWLTFVSHCTINRKTKSYTICVSFSVSSSISKDIFLLFSMKTLVKINKTYIFFWCFLELHLAMPAVNVYNGSNIAFCTDKTMEKAQIQMQPSIVISAQVWFFMGIGTAAFFYLALYPKLWQSHWSIHKSSSLACFQAFPNLPWAVLTIELAYKQGWVCNPFHYSFSFLS